MSTEADNFICVMPSPIAGARAAAEMRRAILNTMNFLLVARAHFQILLNGIGLDCGVGVVVDREDSHEKYPTRRTIGEDLVKVAKSCAQDVWLVACKKTFPHLMPMILANAASHDKTWC